MPFLVPIIAVVASALIASSPAIIAVLGVTGAALLGAGAAIAISAVGTALAPKQKSRSGTASAFTQQQRDLTQLIRSSIAPRRIVYGETRVSGPIVFAATPGGATGSLWLVVPLAAHSVAEFMELYLNDSIANTRASDGQNYYRQNIRASGQNLYDWTFAAGFDDQVALSDIVAANTGVWTNNHRLRGVTYVKVRLSADPAVWTTGIPNISVVLKGRLVYDPRDGTIAITSSAVGTPGQFTTAVNHGLAAGQRVFIKDHIGVVPPIAKEFQIGTIPAPNKFTLLGNDGSGSVGESLRLDTGGTGGTLTVMKWSDNAALCILDFLLMPFGFNIDTDEFDSSTFISAANICDEMVTVSDVVDTVSGADAALLALNGLARLSVGYEKYIETGDAVVLTSTGTMPGGLTAGTTYYYIRMQPYVFNTAPKAGQPGSPRFKLATTRLNALAGVAITLSSAGSGTITITRKSQARYTLHGQVLLDVPPLDAVRSMLSSCAGTLTYVQGTFRLAVGAYVTPTITLDEDDLRGELSIRSRLERQELFNTVRGNYVSPTDSYLATEFPQITSATLKADDGGEEISRDVEFPFTNDNTRAQRLAKITLLRARTGGRVINYPAKLGALRIAPQDTIMINNSKLGLVGAPFLVTDWRLSDDLGVDLTLAAVASADFSWSASEAATPDRPATLELIDASFVSPPGLALTQENIATDGGDTVFNLIATLTAPGSINVSGYEVEYKLSTDLNYRQLGTGSLLIYRVANVSSGLTYDVRARTLSGTGAKSDYATQSLSIVPPTGGTGTLWDSLAGNWDAQVGNWDDL